MDGLDPSVLQMVAGFLLMSILFVVREIASGALKEVGKEFWNAFKKRGDHEDNGGCRDP